MRQHIRRKILTSPSICLWCVKPDALKKAALRRNNGHLWTAALQRHYVANLDACVSYFSLRCVSYSYFDRGSVYRPTVNGAPTSHTLCTHQVVAWFKPHVRLTFGPCILGATYAPEMTRTSDLRLRKANSHRSVARSYVSHCCLLFTLQDVTSIKFCPAASLCGSMWPHVAQEGSFILHHSSYTAVAFSSSIASRRRK